MKSKKNKFLAAAIALVFLGTMFFVPASSLETNVEKSSLIPNSMGGDNIQNEEYEDPGTFVIDRNYIVDPEPAPLNLEDYDDAGYRTDAGDEIARSSAIYPGELVDDTPGRGVTAKLSSTDDEDWYFFSVCDGQDIVITMTPPSGFDFNLGLWDDDEIERATSINSGSTVESITYTADYTGKWYMRVHYISGSGEGQYSFDVTLATQNDAGSGDDAGDTFADATPISEGTHYGYLDMNDGYDWYKFNVNPGDGIHFLLEMKTTTYLSDFDIYLYNPSEELVYYETYYYDDELWYPADVGGEWRVKIDIFPGWINIPQPTEWDYYTYGSGAYELTFAIESDAPAPPGPIPQPDITPIAKTFKVANDPDSNDDEYGYLASIPACNYLEGGERYLAPIVYEGDDTPTNYFDTEYDRGVVDDTTQYLVDDWNDYLASYGKSALEYNVPSDPIDAAADIATSHWGSSDLAVVAVCGSEYEDTTKTVLSRTRTLRRTVDVIDVPSDSPDLDEDYGYSFFLGPKWGAIGVEVFGITSVSGSASGSTLGNIFPHYLTFGGDWWPVPNDVPGDAVDIYYPASRMGVWHADSGMAPTQWDSMRITKYAGHKYYVRVGDPDSVLSVKVETSTPSDLLVFLVDPDGNLRAPDIPRWNGPVNPIHVWNGFEDPEIGYDDWRTWAPEPHTEFSAEVLHPDKGYWTVIVVPRSAEGDDIKYTVTGELRTTNQDRANAAVSAANAAVIASLEHVPLLYVNDDSIPVQTDSALTSLGVDDVIFVGKGGLGEGVKSQLPNLVADLTTMQEIVDYIKGYDASENYITITSIKTGDGYFAPSAMLAAYHGSPVLRIGEAPGNPAGVANRIENWRIWSGDYYHGSRSTGHLPVAEEPINIGQIRLLIEFIKFIISGGQNGELPPYGMDAKRYWNEELHDAIYNWVSGYGLDLDGQEAYCFVAPRNDINLPAQSVMLGNNSYSGQIPGLTPAYSSALAVRSVLYPALIYANPNRDITTTQLMNYPDGGTWRTNDGINHQVYSSREVKESFSSHGRTFEGHCLWDAHLERMNEGASAMYYSGHGTGGSGISAQLEQSEHSNYPDQIWWDAWRGYNFDTWKTARYNGRVWYNSFGNMLYDIIHFDYVDELFENLRSNACFWMSCTTGDAYGPLVYLDHGAVLWYGNAGSGLCPEADLQDDEFFKDSMIYGEPVGQAFSKQVWLHYRDFTTKDPTSMYGPSSLYDVTTVQVIYGDPNLIVYSPEWTSPTPVVE